MRWRLQASSSVHAGGSEEKGAAAVTVYHATSSLRNPATYSVFYEAGLRHFYENPRVGKNGEIIPTRELCFFSSIARFHLYMLLTFKLPLEVRRSDNN